VKRAKLIGHYCVLIKLAIIGKDTEQEQFDGYLHAVYDRLDRDVHLLQKVCDETNYLAEIRAALLILQSIRFNPNENPQYGPKANRPREVLPTYAKAIAGTIREYNLIEPEPEDVRRVLEDYRMFTEIEIAGLLEELPSFWGNCYREC
jgi:hypothetical protein